MDLKEIKEIIKTDGGKFIIIEDDKPVFVIMSFEDFKKKTLNGQSTAKNTETRELKEEKIYQERTRAIPPELEDEPLKIEDLPF